jgi:hypothetical protein
MSQSQGNGLAAVRQGRFGAKAGSRLMLTKKAITILLSF